MPCLPARQGHGLDFAAVPAQAVPAGDPETQVEQECAIQPQVEARVCDIDDPDGVLLEPDCEVFDMAIDDEPVPDSADVVSAPDEISAAGPADLVSVTTAKRVRRDWRLEDRHITRLD